MTGQMFFDDSKKLLLADAVARAAGIYSARNGGKQAQVCRVNAGQYPTPPDYAAGVRIEATRYVMPNHYWAGEDGQE